MRLSLFLAIVLTAGDTWTAHVTVPGHAAQVRVRVGATTVLAKRSPGGTYAARLTFPEPGTFTALWRVRARPWHRFATVRVASLPIRSPSKLFADRDGTLLVADGDRVARLDPRTKTVGLVTRSAGLVAEAVRSADGSLYVLAGDRLKRLAGGGDVPSEGGTGLALDGRGGAWIAQYGGALQHVDLASGVSTTVATFDHPHGVTVDGSSVLVADTYAGTVWRIDDAGRRTRVATELGHPISIARAADGTLFVTDAEGRRLVRVAPNGAVAVVARLTGQPTGIAIGRDGALYVAQVDGDFTVARVDPATGAITPLTT
jgi:hypothetical protein